MNRSFQQFTTRLREIGLLEAVKSRALAHHVTLQDLYEGPRTASIVDARCDVYNWLSKEGKSVNEIARLFDRAPNSVVKQVWKRSAKKAASKVSGRAGKTNR